MENFTFEKYKEKSNEITIKIKQFIKESVQNIQELNK